MDENAHTPAWQLPYRENFVLFPVISFHSLNDLMFNRLPRGGKKRDSFLSTLCISFFCCAWVVSIVMGRVGGGPAKLRPQRSGLDSVSWSYKKFVYQIKSCASLDISIRLIPSNWSWTPSYIYCLQKVFIHLNLFHILLFHILLCNGLNSKWIK